METKKKKNVINYIRNHLQRKMKTAIKQKNSTRREHHKFANYDKATIRNNEALNKHV